MVRWPSSETPSEPSFDCSSERMWPSTDHDIINLIDIDLQQRIAKVNSMDKDAETALLLLLNGHTTDDLTMENFEDRNILFYQGQSYIPQNTELWQNILKTFQDHETAGHPGELQTYNAVHQHYWWPGLRTFVWNYVQGCGICQQFKIDQNPSKPAFIPTEGSLTTWPFAHCSMDLITNYHLQTDLILFWPWSTRGLWRG